MHINDELPPLQPRNRMLVPQELRAIIANATAKDADDRYQNAGAMLNALDYAMGNVSGLYQMPVAADSSPSLRVVGADRGGASARSKMATANTLMFGEGERPAPFSDQSPDVADDHAGEKGRDTAMDGGSNQVSVHDPLLDTDVSFERYSGSRQKKLAALVAVLLLLLVGGISVAMLDGGSDPAGEPVAADEVAGDEGDEVVALDEPAAGPADENPAPEVVPEAPSELNAGVKPEPERGASTKAAVKPRRPEADHIAVAPTPERESADETSDESSGESSDKSSGESSGETSAKTVAKKSDPAPDRKSNTRPESSQDTPEEKHDPAAKPEKFEPKKFALPPAEQQDAPQKFKPTKWN
jgi:hypothetical protein